MSHAQFVHLRVHSAYSLLEGAIKVKALVEACAAQAMPAAAITDTGNLFGALEFSLAAAKAGVQPIVGMVTPLLRPEEWRTSRSGPVVRPEIDRVVLLAQSEEGYRNLMALTSRAYLASDSGAEPSLNWEDLDQRTEGVIALTGGVGGPVGQLLAAGRQDQAAAALGRLRTAFDDRLYVELMRHDLAIEERLEPAFIDLAHDHDLPLVATNDAYFLTAEAHEAHDALLCIAGGSYIREQNRRRETPEHWLKPPEAMAKLFADIPEAISNTLAIAQRCHYMPQVRAPILPAYPTEQGRSEADELEAQAMEGLSGRLAVLPEWRDLAGDERPQAEKPYYERLQTELSIIKQMGYPGYFLIVSDFIRWAKDKGIPVGPGRGSGAGSVVAWALGITGLDPIRLGLLFERFLNPERVSMPDFDVDFCQDRRDEVISYVCQRYGADHVAQIITFGTLQARAVLRDVGRVLQLGYNEVDKVARLVPNNPADPKTLAQSLDLVPELRDFRANDRYRALFDIALQLEGLNRQASTHAAGVVIADRPLTDLVPLYRDPRSDMPATQFNMKYVEQAGLVKFDFLGLKTLTVIDKAVELVRATGQDLDIDQIPLDNRAAYELMGRAQTTGVFQLEGAGMRDVLRRLKPNRFEDIIALVSLYRPGPMENIPLYIETKQGRKQPDYLHPLLEPILKETFGIMIYQEQVMQVAQVLANYSLGQADLLRRAMGKKIKEEMAAQKQSFIDGAKANGVSASQASGIFDQVDKFAGYGFNKSHAAAYALVAYQTAYLKANHPVEFFAASMTLDQGNTDKLDVYRQEVRRMAIPLLPPDINHSHANFAVEASKSGDGEEKRSIRYALGAIKGVGLDAMHAVVREREANGPFKDLFEFAERVDVRVLNKRQLEHLAAAGAFDSLQSSRALVDRNLELLLRYAQNAAHEKASGQTSMFAGASSAADRPRLVSAEDWSMEEQHRRELDAIGFYLTSHPIDAYDLGRLGCHSLDKAQEYFGQGREKARVACVVTGWREQMTRQGKRMSFAVISDPSGSLEVNVFEEQLPLVRPVAEPGSKVVMGLEARIQDNNLRVSVADARDLDVAYAEIGSTLDIHVQENFQPQTLQSVLERIGKGGGQIVLHIPVANGRHAIVELPKRYKISPKGQAALKGLPGVAWLSERQSQ